MKNGMITEAQAQRLITWAIENGHPKEKAYEALAAVMNAKVPEEKEKEGSTQPNKL